MRLSEDIKPISYLKNNTAQVLKTITANKRPMVITQNGEAKMIVQDIESYEKYQENLTLHMILKLREQEVIGGKTTPHEQVVKEMREKFFK
ncbi:MAG: hypothetical protein Ctma_0435 [Catillopecten margaritatus gill symbiont]|uniref:Antitoxin n=1 Tax=Catillopecten margaritatus gill symbiont TaxID=3083288 RepID=A0AAU6PFF4_9GAMM